MQNMKLDLRALEQPTLELTLLDDAATTLHLTIPETSLVEKLMAIAPELKAIQQSQDDDSIQKLYSFAADLISNNEEGVTVTAEELNDVYKLRFVHLVFIFRDYLKFIRGIENVKN